MSWVRLARTLLAATLVWHSAIFFSVMPRFIAIGLGAMTEWLDIVKTVVDRFDLQRRVVQ